MDYAVGSRMMPTGAKPDMCRNADKNKKRKKFDFSLPVSQIITFSCAASWSRATARFRNNRAHFSSLNARKIKAAINAASDGDIKRHKNETRMVHATFGSGDTKLVVGADSTARVNTPHSSPVPLVKSELYV